MFALYGNTMGKGCICGNVTFGDEHKVDESECDMECPGLIATKCGGSNRKMSVYDIMALSPGENAYNILASTVHSGTRLGYKALPSWQEFSVLGCHLPGQCLAKQPHLLAASCKGCRMYCYH